MQVWTESSIVWVLQHNIILWVYFLYSPPFECYWIPSHRKARICFSNWFIRCQAGHTPHCKSLWKGPHLLPRGLCDWLSHEPATECDRPWLPLCFPHGSKCEVASTSSSHIWNMSSVTSFSTSQVSAVVLRVLQKWMGERLQRKCS